VNITILAALPFPDFLMLIIAKKREIVNCEYYHFGRVNFPHFLEHIISKEFEKVNPLLRTFWNIAAPNI